MSELLALSRVSKSYRRGPEEIHALRDVTLVLRPGELVGLVGPSGSGKSTLLMVAAGWERPDEGAVSWHGEGGAPGGAPWSAIALVPQRLGLVDELTVAENVAMPLRLAGGASSEIDLRTDELLAPLDLAPLAQRRPSETSLGEQQRTAMARALALRPALLLADEPTGHQDARREVLVLRALQDLIVAGSCCLLATHNPAALAVCSRVVVMADGAIVEERGGEANLDLLLWGRDPR